MKLIWLPGYAFLYFYYLLPVEWGTKRNVARSGRWWQERHKLAPFFSVLFYLCIVVLALDVVFSGTNTETRPEVERKSMAVPPADSSAYRVPDRPVFSGAQQESIKARAKPAQDSTPAPSLSPGPVDPPPDKPVALTDSSPAPSISPRPVPPGSDKPVAASKVARYEALVVEREVRQQYSGTDELVRCRLGLPPRKLPVNQQDSWGLMLEKSDGDEKIAFTWMLERYCSR